LRELERLLFGKMNIPALIGLNRHALSSYREALAVA
jgi:hypothetical protein